MLLKLNFVMKPIEMTQLKRYKITITVTTTDCAIDTRIIDPISSILDESRGERLDSVSLPTELPLIKND